MYFTLEQLNEIDTMRDAKGNRVVDSHALMAGSWMYLNLRRTILESKVDQKSLNLLHTGKFAPFNEQNRRSAFLVPEFDNVTMNLLSDARVLSSTLYYDDGVENPIDLMLKKYDTNNIVTWTSYPPFRFSVEFSNLSKIPDKCRMYSNSVWYMGTYWGVFVERIGSEFGVFLSRGNVSLESPKPVSVPYYMQPTVTEKKPEKPTMTTVKDDWRIDCTNYSNRPNNQSASNFAENSHIFLRSSETSPLSTAMLEYDDKRTTTMTYFKILAQSHNGNPVLDCFTSMPNSFNRVDSRINFI
ncbi:hypothetical protein V1514DRAFT_338249 [Lipomyces japonicus]|uniref:uncharacterized protein n=1 Tax=Lipomyces japonicus TaxID=56871 RepID=UPI0034CE61FE